MDHGEERFEQNVLRCYGSRESSRNTKTESPRRIAEAGSMVYKAHINGRGGFTRESKGNAACGKLLRWPRKPGSSKPGERLLGERQAAERRRSTVARLVRS